MSGSSFHGGMEVKLPFPDICGTDSGVKLERGGARDYRVAFPSRQPSVGRRSSNCVTRGPDTSGELLPPCNRREGFGASAHSTDPSAENGRQGERQKNRWNQRIREMTMIIMASFRATSTAQQEAVGLREQSELALSPSPPRW
ncbi:hypothetical protein DFH08DRAFT_819423 [Mycena albidolilacea]|uniref:Uncharacterized protein n=1 Tax=Mycena albidolilacea TaxID=1033008 RepID=A0AAD7EFI0_9AGAR|nr:hypothetical protein DFH08DRAFT_819423 [Mycena albidolilacea]